MHVYLIPNFHYDNTWHMTSQSYEDFTSKNILRPAVEILKQEKTFHFTIDHLSSLEYFKDQYPEESEYLRGEISKGRVEIVGPMYTQPDSLILGGESLIRQCLYGTAGLKNLWGMKSSVEWLTDVYGYCNQIPQILKKTGTEYLVISLWWIISHPEGREFLKKLSSEWDFVWRGIDDSKILVHNSSGYWGLQLPGDKYISHCPCPDCGEHDREKKKKLISSPDAYEKTKQAFVATQRWESQWQSAKKDSSFMHMGGDFREPYRENINLITKLSTEKGLPAIVLSTPKRYFQTLKRRSLPVVNGEINPIYKGRFGEGYFETKVWIKQLNRQFEHKIAMAEISASIVYSLGKGYPAEKIKKAYKPLLFYQHHDPFIGNIPKAEYDLLLEKWRTSIKAAESIIRHSLNYLGKRIKMGVDGTPLMIFNTNSWPRSDIVEITHTLPPGNLSLKLENSRGKCLPVQMKVIDYYPDKTIHKAKLSVLAREIPAFGYETYCITTKKRGVSKRKGISIKKKTGPFNLENKFYRMEINDKGQIQGFYDKVTGREAVRPGHKWNEFVLEEDLGCFCFVKTTNRTWFEEPIAEPSIIAEGPLFSQINFETKINDLIIKKVLVAYGFSQRIDFYVQVNLPDGEDKRLKIAFPLNLRKGRIIAETPFGCAERIEGIAPMINWVDYAGEGLGFTIFNCGIPSYEAAGGNIYLNLIKGLSLKDPMQGCLPPNLRKEMIEKGDFEFKYAIQPHGDISDIKDMVRTGYEFNVPLLVATFPKHPGSLPSKKSFVNLKPDNLLLYTIKKSETGQSLIARIYETQGKSGNIARLRTPLPVATCSLCDLLENDERFLKTTKRTISFKVKKHEIVTLKLKLAARDAMDS